MKRIVTSEQMKYLDARTIEYHKIPSLVLMERAALAVVKHLKNRNLNKVLVLCGSGNNGGDGIAITRLLHVLGYDVAYYFPGNEKKMSEGCRKQMEIASTYQVKRVNNPDYCEYTTIVDALFGVGLSRDITGVYKSIICDINKSEAEIVAVDIPSGISSDDGSIMGCAIKADITVTFAFSKIGHMLYPGKSFCGNIFVEDIGIYQGTHLFQDNYYCLEKDDMKLIPIRKRNGNKGTFGKVLLIAGSPDMPGASVLSGQAIMRTGAGMLRIVAPRVNKDILVSAIPEAILDLYNDHDVFVKLEQALMWCDVVVMGPGLSKSELAHAIVTYIIRHCKKPLVLDADGLNIISDHRFLLKEINCPCIMTPHVGEMARLVDQRNNYVTEHLVCTAKTFALDYNIQCVLKDAVTCIALPDQRVYLNNTGNSGMATAGSGDVLAGIIGGLLAVGVSFDLAGALGCWIHGACGDKIKNKLGEGYLMASDLVKELSSFRIGEE